MSQSENRILTTHVGSLVRPERLVRSIQAIEDGVPVDMKAFDALTAESTLDVLKKQKAAGVDIVLYCCGAYRAMNKAALNFSEAVRRDGTQKHVIDTLQTRAELYDFLGYHAYEDKLDALFAQNR